MASYLLPRWSRPHVMVFYAFARAADDIADAPELDADEKLDRLRLMSAQLRDGGEDVVREVSNLRDSIAETGVTAQHAQDLLKAFMWDVEHPRTMNWQALLDYCQLSAAPVGRYLIDLMGGCADGYRSSDALCAALQVLNHIQDVRADYVDLNRVYVPSDWLAREGVEFDTLGEVKASQGMRVVLDQMLEGVEQLLSTAQPLPRVVTSKALSREAGGILQIAQRLSLALKARDPLAERVELSKPQLALWFVWGALRA